MFGDSKTEDIISQYKTIATTNDWRMRLIFLSLFLYTNKLQTACDKGVVESIKKNTSNIKMLALNASIEAARAGEYGRGFTIVAHEMGKLSQMSSESVAGINDTLNDISKSIKETTELINKI